MRWQPSGASSFRQGEVRGETQRREFFTCWVWAVLETGRYTPGVESQRKDPGWRYQNVKWLTRVCPRGKPRSLQREDSRSRDPSCRDSKGLFDDMKKKEEEGETGKDVGRADCTANTARVLPSDPATVSSLSSSICKTLGKAVQKSSTLSKNYWYNVSYIAYIHSDPCPEQGTEDS